MREKSQNEYVHTVVNTMQMQVMNEIRVMVSEVERKLKVQPTAKFDSTYLEESIELIKKQVFSRMDRSEASAQNDLIRVNQELAELRHQVMNRIVEETNLQL